jgi:hypothetical protein
LTSISNGMLPSAVYALTAGTPRDAAVYLRSNRRSFARSTVPTLFWLLGSSLADIIPPASDWTEPLVHGEIESPGARNDKAPSRDSETVAKAVRIKPSRDWRCH